MIKAANTITSDGGNFSSMPNELLNDSAISLTAKGLYIFMRGKPAGWNFTIRSMAKQLKEGETAIGSAMNELKSSGWMTYTKHSSGAGVYHLYWSAIGVASPDGNEPKPENPNQGNPKKGKPQRISKTDQLARKISSKDLNTRSIAKKTATDPAPKKPDPFDELWPHYPKREGSNPKNRAKQNFNARLKEGHTAEIMAQGLKRYIDFCKTKGQTGTGFVMQAQRFFGTALEFLNDWEVSPEQQGKPSGGMIDPSDTSWIHDEWGY